MIRSVMKYKAETDLHIQPNKIRHALYFYQGVNLKHIFLLFI